MVEESPDGASRSITTGRGFRADSRCFGIGDSRRGRNLLGRGPTRICSLQPALLAPQEGDFDRIASVTRGNGHTSEYRGYGGRSDLHDSAVSTDENGRSTPNQSLAARDLESRRGVAAVPQAGAVARRLGCSPGPWFSRAKGMTAVDRDSRAVEALELRQHRMSEPACFSVARDDTETHEAKCGVGTRE